MADISVSALRDDILDRLSNMRIAEEIPESLRVKLRGTTRVTKAMNQAIAVFARDGNAAMLSGLQAEVSPPLDKTASGVKHYGWPATAYSARAEGGVIKVILDDEEFSLEAGVAVTEEDIRYYAGSDLYGTSFRAFYVDFQNRRFAVPEGVTFETRVIQRPDPVNDSNEYGSGGDTEVPIDEVFIGDLSLIGLHELVKMAGNFAGREQVLAATAPAQALAGAGQQQPEGDS